MRAAVALALGTATLAWSWTATAAETGAAQGDEEIELEEVQVTGSRIVRRDNVANSPLLTVDSAQLEARSGLNVESYLNQLPSFNPAATPVTTNADVQISPVNSVGVSTISLRGFGPNRNLVLVDGKRMVPTNALMWTDISSIPSALIQRVETITGGASAVYGADAIGGVTNFITKRNFQGFEVDLQTSLTEAGDGSENRAYALMGTNFAEGRGNVTFGVERYERNAAYEKNRKFYTDSWKDPTVGGDFFVFGYNGFNSAFSFNAPSRNALNAVFSQRPTYTTGPAAGVQTGVRAFTDTFDFGIFEGFRFNNDGSVFATGSGNNLYKFLQGGGVIDNYEYATQRAYDGTIGNAGGQIFGQQMDTLKWNNTDAYVSSPQERYSLFASSNFKVNDNVEVWTRGTFAESETRTRLFPANASYGWEATVSYNPTTDSPLNPALNYADPTTLNAIAAAVRSGTYTAYANPNFIPTNTVDPDGAGPLLGAQHPITPEFALLLNSRANAAGAWILETYPTDSFDDRSTVNTNSLWQIDAGVNYKLPFGDWTGDASVSHGQTATYNNAYGNNSLTRWRMLVTQPDYGRNAALSSNTPETSPVASPPQSVGFGGADITCRTGFYDMIFKGDVRPSDDCRTAVQANLQTHTANVQDVFEANVQGGLFELPAGQVRANVGAQYRKNESRFTPDILQSTSSFADQVVGVYPTGYLDAHITDKDIYAEVLVPLLKDAPFAKSIELEIGGRHSDYSATDSTDTYKISGSWQFNDALRLRGGFNRASRAPNLGELFLNVQEIFTIGGNFGDPCGLRTNAPYGAAGGRDPVTGTVALDPNVTGGETAIPQLAPGQTQAGADSAYLICRAMMGGTGGTAFYAQNQTAPGAGGGFAWVLQQGNPTLDSEKANTVTAGFVFNSRSSNPWLSRISATVDWWKVDIKDAIQQYSTDYASWRCFGEVTVGSTAEATAQANSRACTNVARNQSNGNQVTTLLEYDNQATITTSGIDATFNWYAPFADIGLESVPGGLSFGTILGWTNYYKTKQSPLAFDVETNWVGSLGPNLTGTNPGAYKWRANTFLGYNLGKLGVNLRWNYMSSVVSAAQASQKAIIKNNEAVAAGAEGIILGYTPSTAYKVPAYSSFGLSLNWEFTEKLSLRAGVDNLLDTSPKVTARDAGRPYDESLSQAQNLAALAAVCSAAQQALGCQDPTGFSLANSGAGTTSAGFYDTMGRRYFVGVKAKF